MACGAVASCRIFRLWKRKFHPNVLEQLHRDLRCIGSVRAASSTSGYPPLGGTHLFRNGDVMRRSDSPRKAVGVLPEGIGVGGINYENVRRSAHGRKKSGFPVHLQSPCCSQYRTTLATAAEKLCGSISSDQKVGVAHAKTFA